MRIAPIDRSSEKTFRKLISLFCLSLSFIMISSCATTGQYHGKKVRIEKTRDEETNVVKEVIKNEPKQYTASTTPKARASTGLIENGRKFLVAGDFDNAESSFQEAINVDPSNGIAYYYLAKVKYELALFQQALGILDKAEDLLIDSKEWMETIKTLREMIKEKF